MWRVISASLIRTTLVLGVELEEPREDDRSRILEVEGDPSRQLQLRGGRFLFDSDDSATPRLFMFCDLPDFPADQLPGKRLRHLPNS